MKDSILQNLASVVDALNNVTVRGETSMSNLLGSINAIRQTMSVISAHELVNPPAQQAANPEIAEAPVEEAFDAARKEGE